MGDCVNWLDSCCGIGVFAENRPDEPHFRACLSGHGRFLCTSDFFFLQYSAINVLQLFEPSTASDEGNPAYLQSISQNSLLTVPVFLGVFS